MKAGEVLAEKYRLEKRLGLGGMGEVWKAVHIGTGRDFAIKMMHAHAAFSASARERFRREATVSGKISHPCVIDVFDAGETEDGGLYLVMELLEGLTLSEAFHGSPTLTMRDFVSIMVDTSSALSAAHAAGIVHRDIKSSNIFLHRERSSGLFSPKLLDFGISKLSNNADANNTKTGAVLGSPRYMSPEQARSAAGVDHRADLWALGVVLFEGLTGTWPHEGDSFSSLVVAICTTPPASIDQQAPHLPESLRSIVRDCLQPIESRIASAKELANRLAAVLEDPSLLAISLSRPLHPPPEAIRTMPMGLQIRPPVQNTGVVRAQPRGSGPVHAHAGYSASQGPAPAAPLPAHSPRGPLPSGAHAAMGAHPGARALSPHPIGSSGGAPMGPRPWGRPAMPSAPYPIANPMTPSGPYPIANPLSSSGSYPVANPMTPSGSYRAASLLSSSGSYLVANAMAPSGPSPAANTPTPSGMYRAPGAPSSSRPPRPEGAFQPTNKTLAFRAVGGPPASPGAAHPGPHAMTRAPLAGSDPLVGTASAMSVEAMSGASAHGRLQQPFLPPQKPSVMPLEPVAAPSRGVRRVLFAVGLLALVGVVITAVVLLGFRRIGSGPTAPASDGARSSPVASASAPPPRGGEVGSGSASAAPRVTSEPSSAPTPELPSASPAASSVAPKGSASAAPASKPSGAKKPVKGGKSGSKVEDFGSGLDN